MRWRKFLITFGIFAMLSLSNGALRANCFSFSLVVAQNSINQNAPKEFFELAKALSADSFLSIDEWDKKQKTNSLESIVKELREAILLLEGIKSSDSSINRIVGNALSAAKDVDSVIDEISRTPAPPSEWETIIGSIIIGALAEDALQGALGGGALGAQQGQARENYTKLMQKVETSVNRFSSVCSLIPSLAKKYCAKNVKNDRFSCDINETIVPNFPDFILVYNHGKELEMVSVNMKIKGTNAETENFVFIEKWPEKSWVYIPCQGKSTVNGIQNVTLSVYSNSYSTEFITDYTKEEKEKDVKESLKNVDLACKYQAFEAGLIWDTNRGVRIKMTGFPILIKPRVTVTFSSAGFLGQSKALYWDLEILEAGMEKTFESKEFTFNPTNIKIKITLPYCDHEIIKDFAVK